MKRIYFPCLLAVFFAAVASSEPIELRYRFTPGDQLMYVINASGSGTIEIAVATEDSGEAPDIVQKIPVDMNLFMSMHMDVKDVDERGWATLVSKINKYRLSQGDTVIVDLDGEKKAADGGEAAGALEAMKEPLILVVDRLGGVREVSGFEKLSEMAPQFDIPRLISQMQQPFPDKPVDVGDTWKQPLLLGIEDPSDGPTGKELINNFEFLGFEKVKELNCAKIRSWFSGDITSLMNEVLSSVPAPGAELNQVVMDFESDIFFEPDAGVLVAIKFKMKQEMTMSMNLPVMGKNQHMKMKMDMIIKGVYELE